MSRSARGAALTTIVSVTSTTAKHRMTVEEYLVFVGAVGLDAVELVNGEVYDVSPEGPLHSDVVAELAFLLHERYPQLKVKPAGSVRLDDRTLVQPDVYVLNMDRHAPFASNSDYPSVESLLLAVEVAVSTFTYDVATKLPAYARAGLGEYWLISPTADGEAFRFTRPQGATYRDVERVELPEGIASLGALRAWLG